jgi:hypothetical protein
MDPSHNYHGYQRQRAISYPRWFSRRSRFSNKLKSLVLSWREPAWKLVLFVRTTWHWFILFFKHCFMSRTYCCATRIVSWYFLTGRQMSLTACPVPASDMHYPYNPTSVSPDSHPVGVHQRCAVIWIYKEPPFQFFLITMSELENYWFWFWTKLESKNHRSWVSEDTLKESQFSWIGRCCNGECFSNFWEEWLYIRNDPLMITARGLFLYLLTA